VVSPDQHAFNTNNLRWRYVQLNDPYFSNVVVGETNTSGITSRSITGVKISNKPVQPRFIYGRYAIDGTVQPQSEVELYFNNQLINYQKADASGHYRFVVPLTYGSTSYSVRIYTPSGQTIRRKGRIQIPYDYLPAGEIDYTLSGGRLRRPVLGLKGKGYMGSGSVSAGFTNWLTGKVSSEYLTRYQARPTITGTLDARLFSNYLISANVNSARFYRLTTSVVYPGGASWRLSYDYNPGRSRLYNIGGYLHQARFNLFTPLHIGSVPLNFRLLSTYQRMGTSAGILRYRADLSTRLGRVNARLEY
jgi:outer membrane usher protein FimD/PapC